jgi:hypothetical protein
MATTRDGEGARHAVTASAVMNYFDDDLADFEDEYFEEAIGSPELAGMLASPAPEAFNDDDGTISDGGGPAPLMVEGDAFPLDQLATLDEEVAHLAEEQTTTAGERQGLPPPAAADTLLRSEAPGSAAVTHVPVLLPPTKKKVVWASVLCHVASTFLMPHVPLRPKNSEAVDCQPEEFGRLALDDLRQRWAGTSNAPKNEALSTAVREVVNVDMSRYWVVTATKPSPVFHHWHQMKGTVPGRIPAPEWKTPAPLPPTPTPFHLLHPSRSVFDGPGQRDVRSVRVALETDKIFPHIGDLFETILIGSRTGERGSK